MNTIDKVLEKNYQIRFQTVQLHGDETVTYVNELKSHFEQSEKSYQKNLKHHSRVRSR